MTTDNPHNQYLLVLCQFGLLGLLIFLSIFYLQIQNAFAHQNPDLQPIQFAIPIFFLTIFLGESYLQISTTTHLFAAFSSFLYKTKT